jgi:hypothetical protein
VEACSQEAAPRASLVSVGARLVVTRSSEQLEDGLARRAAAANERLEARVLVAHELAVGAESTDRRGIERRAVEDVEVLP